MDLPRGAAFSVGEVPIRVTLIATIKVLQILAGDFFQIAIIVIVAGILIILPRRLRDLQDHTSLLLHLLPTHRQVQEAAVVVQEVAAVEAVAAAPEAGHREGN
jgi:hypothetical protein